MSIKCLLFSNFVQQEICYFHFFDLLLPMTHFRFTALTHLPLEFDNHIWRHADAQFISHSQVFMPDAAMKENCRNTMSNCWHFVVSSSSSNWCYQGHWIDFLDIPLWRISHITRTSEVIHPEWTPHSRLMKQYFIWKRGQIFRSRRLQNWICRIVTVFVEFPFYRCSQRIH